MTYCPDCGCNSLKILVSSFGVTCSECNYTANSVGYLNRFNTLGVTLTEQLSNPTKFKVKIKSTLSDTSGQFFNNSGKLIIVVLESTGSSYLWPLINLLRKAFGDKILIQIKQVGTDPLLTHCPLCEGEILYFNNDSLVCFDCACFRVTTQDFVAGLICAGEYECKSESLLSSPALAHSYLNLPLPENFYVLSKSQHAHASIGNALAEVQIRNGSDSSATVIAIRPITADPLTLKDIENQVLRVKPHLKDSSKPFKVRILKK